MQKPHDSVFENNPSFAYLYPQLDAKVEQLLNDPAHEEQRVRLQDRQRLWTKLRILWTELQLLLSDKRYAQLAAALSDHVAAARFPQQYSHDLASLKIPVTHTFIDDPHNQGEQLQILSDILVAEISEKLMVFRQLQAVARQDDDLLTERETRDTQRKAYIHANTTLLRQISDAVSQVHSMTSARMHEHADYLEKVQHGSAEKFTSSYLDYHDAATVALLSKSQKTQDNLMTCVYSPQRRRELEQRALEIQGILPKVEEQLASINRDIEGRESAKTPEYVEAITEYQRLKKAIQQAEQDIDQLEHYSTRGR